MSAPALCCTPRALAAPSLTKSRLAAPSLSKARLFGLALPSTVPCSFASGKIKNSDLACQTARPFLPTKPPTSQTTTSLTTPFEILHSNLENPSRCQRGCLAFCLVFVFPASNHSSQHSHSPHHFDSAFSWTLHTVPFCPFLEHLAPESGVFCYHTPAVVFEPSRL